MYENSQDPVHVVFLHTRMSGAQFDPSHGAMQEIDYRETPLGMISGLVGRSKDVIWVRWSEWIMPNIHQFHITESAGDCVIKLRPPRATRWHVPVDDTHTVVFDYQRLLDKELDRADKVLKSFGQRGDRSYAEQQRRPGDYEAQVSQRPIAIHALEHLGSSDRGVIMFRKLLRQQIRAVRQGKDPKGVDAMGDKPIATYLRNISFVAPPRPSPKEDRKLWRETARKVAEEALVDRDSRWKSNITLTPYEGTRSEFSG